jgi:hypothetical protein
MFDPFRVMETPVQQSPYLFPAVHAILSLRLMLRLGRAVPLVQRLLRIPAFSFLRLFSA